MLIVHMVIAIMSLIAAGIVLMRPSSKLLTISYGLIASTIVSGGALILLGSSLLHVCAAGFVYSVVAVSMVAVARKRLVVSR